MTGSPDIKRAIEIIEQRIQSLQQIKGMLVNEFFGEETTSPSSSEAWFINPPPPHKHSVKKTRKEVLIELLKKEGPATRLQIRTKTGFPIGTVATLLNDKRTFQRLDDGRWTLATKE